MLTAAALEAPRNASRTARAADEAMTRYARGEDGAFAAVHAFVAPRLGAYLRRRLRDAARVSDLVQQTFLHMHRARATFRPGSDVLPWAFAIARRQLIDHLRATAGEPEFADLAELEPWLPSPSLEEHLAAKEAARRFEQALEGLSRPQRAAFELVKGEGLSLAQAASALGTTVTGVKLRTHRAYAALRSALVTA